MKRVVITGLGMVSCLGNDRASVTDFAARPALRASAFIPEYKELGFRSHVGGMPDIDLDARIDRKQRRFQGDAAAFAHIAHGRRDRRRRPDRRQRSSIRASA